MRTLSFPLQFTTVAALTLTVAVGATGCGLLPDSGKEGKTSQTSASTSDKRAVMDKAKPAKLRIAAAGVNAGPVLELGPERRKGEMIPEKQANSPGWFTDTATPGEKGVAVLVARYGTAGGPGLMKNVNKVRVGDPIQVDRADGTTAAFKITKIQQVTDETPPQQKKEEKEKDKPSPQAELRVITLSVPMEAPKASKEDKKKDEDKEDAKSPDGPRTSNVVFYAELAK